ncbi:MULTISPECIES: DUF4174 domain-containing protein [unclassified Allomuricauda]|uniref:DUF4174 domain-containing protein n=1 Tax=unclassified Allomuricauda TaxID=2615049 RepID=UPI00273D2733|nr:MULTISPECIES: DUF4174 domain-containing protein [unclassified Allomuricauda]
MKNPLILKILILMSYFATKPMSAQNLDNHKWKHRILIVKTAVDHSERFADQLLEFKDSNKELRERKLVLYAIRQDEFSFTDYTNNMENYTGKLLEKGIKPMLNANEAFEIILIGLDGGIKLRKNDIVSQEELFSTIDAMPMRRNEMRN